MTWMLTLILDDPTREAVLKFLASYGGMAAGVAVLVSGIKSLWKTWVEGKEPKLALILTFILGIAAKFILPDVYGPHTVAAWALHLIVLIFVAVGAGGFHQFVINALVKKADPVPKQ